MTTGTLLLRAWDPGLGVPLVCALALAAYGMYYRRSLGAPAAFFGAAVALFAVALASPIGVLARGTLFSAHMLQHLLLTLAVPALVLLGLPRDHRTPVAARPVRRTSAHVGPWAAGVGAMWIWHAPSLCNAAAVSGTIRVVQTTSLIAMGLAFWWPILGPRSESRMAPFAAVLYLFAACVACTLLGVMVTLSPVEVCSAYVHPADTLGVLPLVRNDWGLSCRADQEIGGLLMWVPTCFVYAAAILATLARYYRGERRLPQTEGAAG